MRLVWVLVVGCLVAATAARPPYVERRDPQVTHLDAAPAGLALVARRAAAQLPELRLAPFVLAPGPTLTNPPRIAATAVEHSSKSVDACAHATTCARGPPNA